ncbi:ABC transporter permease [Halomonas sp. BL6]|nr:ABC transporter permease [Halomonas sp. BL6]
MSARNNKHLKTADRYLTHIPAFSIMIYLWLPALLIAWWWLGSENSSTFFLPSLSDSLSRLMTDLSNGTLVSDALFSLSNVFMGLMLAIILGVGTGLLIGYNPTIRGAVWPLVSFLRAIPGVAIVPIVIVAFGVGHGPQIFLIASTCVWPILLNTVSGVRGIRESIIDTARAYRIPRSVYVRHVLFNAAMPQIMAGIRISLSVSLTIMVVSEFSSGNQGLGNYILRGAESFDMPQVWAGTIFIGMIGYLVNVAFVNIEHHVLAWLFEISPRARTTPEKRVLPLQKRKA